MGGSELGAGWLDLGTSLTYSQRSTMLHGRKPMPNMNGAKARSLVYAFDLSLGIWKGLSVKTTFLLLQSFATENQSSQKEFAIGDLPVSLHYLFTSDEFPPKSRFGISAGAYLPTGSTLESNIPSNPNFISGTVDPTIGINFSHDFVPVFGAYTHGFSRLVVAENDAGYRAASSILYGGGVRIKWFQSFAMAFGLNVLHRFQDKKDGINQPDSGGHWIYYAFSANYFFFKGPMKGFSLRLSSQMPVFQYMGGTQLAEDFSVNLGLGYAFQLFGT